mgnify:CR=1 FL=1
MTAQNFENVFQKLSLSMGIQEAFSGTEVRRLTIHKKERSVSMEISAKELKPLPSRAVTVPKETPDETDALQPEDEESTKEAVENTEAVIEITEDAITEKHDSEEHDTTYDHADIGANRQVKRRLSFGFSGGILNSGTEEGNRQYPEVDFAPPVSNPGYSTSNSDL